MLISYRNEKRLLTSKKNKYRYSHPEGEKKIQKSIAVRGALHAESVFGQIENPYTGKLDYVIRKPLSSLDKLKQVEKIVDPAIRQIVKDHIERNGGESKIKEALQKPLFIMSKDSKKLIPIHNVRMIDSATQLIQLRPKENPKLFVDSGSNYCIAIYGDAEGEERDYETISFYTAAKRALTGEAIVRTEKEGLPLLQELKQKDIVIRYQKNPDEIEWENLDYIASNLFYIIKVDTAGQIFMGRHTRSNINMKVDRNKDMFQVSAPTIMVQKVRVSITGKLTPV